MQSGCRSLHLLLVFVALLSCAQATYTIKDFHTIWPWNYKSDGLYEVDIGINKGQDATNTTLSDGTIVVALGDLDDDKHTDMFTLSDDLKTLTVHYYNDREMNFAKNQKLDTGKCKVSAVFVIPNPDYRLAIICSEESSYDYLKLMKKSGESNEFVATDFPNKLEKGSQPFFVDVNSDTYADLLYNQDTKSGSYDLLVSLYDPKEKAFSSSTFGFFQRYIYENKEVGCQAVPDKAALRLSIPSFSTLVDVNADCVSDLYITAGTSTSDVKGLMFISTRIQTDSEEYLAYCLVDVDDLSGKKYTSPVFADFDNDAAIDKAFYETESNSIHVYYNTRGSNSASADSLCKSLPTIKDGSSSDYFKDYTVFSKQPDISPIQNSKGLYAHGLIESFIPGQLRVADLDSDGYPDIITTLKDEKGNPVTVVLVNADCSSQSVTHDIKRNLEEEGPANCTIRTFDTTNDYEKLSKYEDTMYCFVLDFDDNGRMDFVIVERGINGTTTLRTFYNNYSRDSYYLTAATFTGGEESFGSKPYGVSYRGIFTTLSDKKQPFVTHQLTRTSFAALQSPIATYVIGRSNNYIEDFTLTYPIQNYNADGSKSSLTVETFEWSPIIPNSHLLISIHGLFASNWNIQLLINPTDSFLLVGIILSLILIVIGGIIIYIHMKEKKEDEETRNPQLDFF